MTTESKNDPIINVRQADPAPQPLLGDHVTRLEAEAQRLRKNMTVSEKKLWEALRGSRLHHWHFRRQHVIGQVIVDFYCHRAELVVEVDGPIHAVQVEQDTQRDRYLASRGLRVLRVNNDEIEQDLQDVLGRISAACDSPNKEH